MLLNIVYYFLVVLQVILILLTAYFIGKITLIITSWSPLYKGNAPYVPTRRDLFRKAFKMLDIKEGDQVVDLGSGDGQLLIYGANRVNATFTGYEINILLAIVTKIKMFFTKPFRKGKIVFIHGNYTVPSLEKFNKVYIFSLGSLVKRVLPKLEKELKKGTRVMCVMFPMESSYFKLIAEEGPKRYRLHLYEKIK